MNKKKHKRCSYMKVNPLDPKKRTTVKAQQQKDLDQRDNNYFFKYGNPKWY